MRCLLLQILHSDVHTSLQPLRGADFGRGLQDRCKGSYRRWAHLHRNRLRMPNILSRFCLFGEYLDLPSPKYIHPEDSDTYR